MPSKTPAQKRLMAAAAHTKGGFGGVPQKVGKEFNDADKRKKFDKGGDVAPSTAKIFGQNLVESAANPTGRLGLKHGGHVEHGKRAEGGVKSGGRRPGRSG